MDYAEDHPRRCGENEYKKIYNISDMGSPPQVRGKLAVDAASARNSRITPAGAGKTIMFIAMSSIM